MSTVLDGAVPRPSHLAPEDEVLHPIEDVAMWVENYLSQAYCPETEIGFFMHLGEVSFDRRLWDELVITYLPGDEFLVVRAFGYGGHDRGPAGPSLRYECVEPYRVWRKTFKGVARKVTGEQLRAGAIGDGLHVPMEFDLEYRAMGPVFELGEMREQNWASWHYEQHCAVDGSIIYGGTTVELHGSGIRDHSTGQRDLTGLQNHIWCHGEFADGRTFCLMYLSNADGTGRMNHAALCHGDQVRYGHLVANAPLIGDWSQRGTGYELELDFDGKPITIGAELLHVGALTLCGPGEVAVGNAAGSELAHHLLSEAQTRFTLDGEIGYGLTERSVKL
jgi:hypothetical protein